MNTLLELSKRNDDWLRMATKITGCKEKARDLVQDMYLKVGLSDCFIKKEYSNFIYTVMNNINKNQYKKDNTFVENGERVTIEIKSLEDEVNGVNDKLIVAPKDCEL